MNGAQSLVHTLIDSEVDVCFTNPGTSEMHFVAALDTVAGMRCVLGLFEGVITGAADGYARMAGKPAATLLHLGPGLGNALANVHNARKARTPMVNIVGEHATYHLQYETPLKSDTNMIARACSDWVQTSQSASAVASDAAQAVAQARSGGQIATLILPADTAWNESTGPAAPVAPPARPVVDADKIKSAAAILLKHGGDSTLMLTGAPLIEPGLTLAAKIAKKTGCKLLAQQSNARMSRGLGHYDIARVPYAVPQALAQLADIKHLVLLGANPPASFFAYPNQPNMMAPTGCEQFVLAAREHDAAATLQALADELDAHATDPAIENGPALEVPPDGQLTADLVMQTVSALIPENGILCDEAVSSGRQLLQLTGQAKPHDYLQITGGAIGIGSPLATGAAVASPGRQVISLQADGSTMYTLQGLWTQAREQLQVCTIILANRAYRILQGELKRVGVESPGERAQQMLSLSNPDLDWVSLAKGMGVPACSVDTAQGLATAVSAALAGEGPNLIEARIP
ncbi:MAG: acetolactate synthase large subunit [Burkholderiaceae bacterium]